MQSTKCALAVLIAAVTTLAASDRERSAAEAAQAALGSAQVIAQRFSGDLAVGKRRLHVTIADWTVPNGPGMADIRLGGNAVVEELAGKLRTELNGKEQTLRENDILVVPAGAVLRARAVRSTGVFTAIVVSGGAPPSKP